MDNREIAYWSDVLSLKYMLEANAKHDAMVKDNIGYAVFHFPQSVVDEYRSRLMERLIVVGLTDDRDLDFPGLCMGCI